jgi:hypothetical protein
MKPVGISPSAGKESPSTPSEPKMGRGYSPVWEKSGGMLMPRPSDRKKMKEGDTPFHFESGKSRVDQIPPRALLQIGTIMGYGAKKYGDWNWAQYRSDWKWGQLIGSTLRHIYAWMKREDIDPESGYPHLAHAAANLMMLLELIETKNGTDDRNPIGSSHRKGNIGTL